MAQKKSYIYHLLIGHENNVEVDIFMVARNAGVAIDYCKDFYKDKKYNSYQAIKVGVSRTLQDTRIMDDYEAQMLIKSGASLSDFYSEKF